MIIWRPLVGQCLQCVKEPTNKVGKNTVAVVCTNPYCKEEAVDHAQKNLQNCIHISIPVQLRFI